MKTVSKSQLKARLLEYLHEIETSGEPLVVTDRGRPVVRIEPYRAGDDVLELLRGCVVRYDDPTEPVSADEWVASGPPP